MYRERLKKTQLEILDEIDRICCQFNLTYFLAFGTLLGAVRHKGYIPWDDDIDIFMPRKDYNKFSEIAQKGKLNQNYFFHSVQTDKKYWLRFNKIEKKGTIFIESRYKNSDINMGIFVDIFPLDSIDRISLIQKIKRYIFLKIEVILAGKRGIYNFGFFKKLLTKLLPFTLLHLIMNFLTDNEDKKGKYFYAYSGSDAIQFYLFPKDKCIPTKFISFEGKNYYAPNDTNFILNYIYGPDYMKLPPEEKRVSHAPIKISFE